MRLSSGKILLPVYRQPSLKNRKQENLVGWTFRSESRWTSSGCSGAVLLGESNQSDRKDGCNGLQSHLWRVHSILWKTDCFCQTSKLWIVFREGLMDSGQAWIWFWQTHNWYVKGEVCDFCTTSITTELQKSLQLVGQRSFIVKLSALQKDEFWNQDMFTRR